MRGGGGRETGQLGAPELPSGDYRDLPTSEALYMAVAADSTALVGGGTERVGTWSAIFLKGNWHVRRAVIWYNSAVNSGIGTNNSNYLGVSDVELEAEETAFENVAPGATAVFRFLGTCPGVTCVTLNASAATVQRIDADCDFLLRKGSSLNLKWPEDLWWGVFLKAYIMVRQVD